MALIRVSEKVTYALEASLGVVLLLLVERVVDKSERGGPAAAEFRLHTKDCNAVFLSLEHLSELFDNLLLGEGTGLGVDDLESLTMLRVLDYLRPACERGEGS
jgi:hypothetical protein